MLIKGLVIKEYVVGEGDKYITLFTKEIGKIQVYATRAKQHQNGLSASTQLFVYGQFNISKTKNTYRVASVEIIEMFHSIREDILTLSYASYIMEFLLEVTREGEKYHELLNLSLHTLWALSKKIISPKIIKHIFELRALKYLGFMPELTKCVICYADFCETNEKIRFSLEEGGIICGKCQITTPYYITNSVHYMMQYVLATPLKSLYCFEISNKVAKDFIYIIRRYTVYYVETDFKTAHFIQKLEEML
ncbi:MAG: DNA repair protein RecO [Epulopiscium sp. Nele67-Bin005]|nr:MAG: DNA repair protein RecO [Epulopiscium sp. Nele67-Bin005]